jgi:hypothetical protein
MSGVCVAFIILLVGTPDSSAASSMMSATYGSDARHLLGLCFVAMTDWTRWHFGYHSRCCGEDHSHVDHCRNVFEWQLLSVVLWDKLM